MKDSVWSKIITYSFVIFFIRLADSLISFWAPNLIQSSLNNSFLMGLIISFQSVVGLAADMIFPIFLKKGSTKKMTILAILLSSITFILFYISSLRPFVIFLLISMAIWGIYYELAGFSVFQFIDNTASLEKRSGSWGIIDIFINFAYLIGPLIAVWLLLKSSIFLIVAGLSFLLLAFIIFFFKSRRMYDQPLEPEFDGIKPVHEANYWKTLLKTIWPIIIITLITSGIDSTFWTTGIIWTTKLIKVSPLGSLIIPFYQLPTLFVGLILAKQKIYQGKKKLALKFLILAGIFLVSLILFNTIIWILLAVLVASISLSVTLPLVEGVYSDIVARLGSQRKHLIGLSSAVINISYIVWPPIAGFLSGIKGEKMTFVAIGIITVLTCLILYFIMPKKLKLNKKEIENWQD